MQRKRRNINFGYFSGSSGKSKFNNSITKLTLHSIPTVRMSKSNKKSTACISSPNCGLSDISHFTNVVRWTSPHCRSSERRNRTRASHVVMTPLSRLARYRSLSLVAFALGMTVLINCCINIQETFAAEDDFDRFGSAVDYTTISPINVTSTPPTASLTLSKANITSEVVTPGNTATASTNVTVNVSDAESYELYLKVNSATMTNSGTTISAGNAVADNTWGYKWDNASSYSAPSTSGNKLAVPALSNNATSFTKTLTFATKFAATATPGNYKNSGTLSLIARPRAIIYTLDNLTQMQQLSLAPSACANTPYLSGQTYSKEYTLTDVRDGNSYTVRKLGDGRCWMTQNLRLGYYDIEYNYSGGRTLNSTTTDFTGSDITLPRSSKSDFTSANQYTYQAYVSSDYEADARASGYYNWYTATAGAGSSSVKTDNQNVNTSICPKGWTLPTSGTAGKANTESTWSNYYKLFRNMGLTISTSSLSTTSSTNWGSGDLAKVQTGVDSNSKVIYNFKYTGLVYIGSLTSTSAGVWWSSTAYNAGDAYYLNIGSSGVYPGTDYGSRYLGIAVRCIARN